MVWFQRGFCSFRHSLDADISILYAFALFVISLAGLLSWAVLVPLLVLRVDVLLTRDNHGSAQEVTKAGQIDKARKSTSGIERGYDSYNIIIYRHHRTRVVPYAVLRNPRSLPSTTFRTSRDAEGRRP